MNHSKRIIDVFSDTRIPPETVVTNLMREPLQTHEMFIYTFSRYIYAMNHRFYLGQLRSDLYQIGRWTAHMLEPLETLDMNSRK